MFSGERSERITGAADLVDANSRLFCMYRPLLDNTSFFKSPSLVCVFGAVSLSHVNVLYLSALDIILVCLFLSSHLSSNCSYTDIDLRYHQLSHALLTFMGYVCAHGYVVVEAKMTEMFSI